MVLADEYVTNGDSEAFKRFESAVEDAYDMQWESFKTQFDKQRAKASASELAVTFRQAAAGDVRARVDNVARAVNRLQVQRYAMTFLETGITNYYGEFDRESTALQDDEWAELKSALREHVADASDARLQQRFPNRQPTVIRNRYDNIARYIVQQQAQRDAGTLVAYRDPQYVLELDEKPNQPRRPLLRVTRQADNNKLGPAMLALIVVASLVLVVILVLGAWLSYKKLLQYRERKRAAAAAGALPPTADTFDAKT